ncbi:MAG TPA: DNA adenine methylase [Polyangiales bacterium]|nr:DNA adenine methylase [Polyangiales bacterium]
MLSCAQRAARTLDNDARNERSACASARPFLKWVGGKRALLPSLCARLPPGVDRMRHVEPFAGGAALFFDRAPNRALLCDVNPDLVTAYQAVRDEVEVVLRHLAELAGRHDKECYYQARVRYNAREHASDAERAALFIYLNKTCFNGLYRVNKRGHFNVPMGRYTRPTILDASALRRASARLHGVDVRCAPFQALIELGRPGDFVYLDPPYEPLSRTANFTAYARDGFTQSDQRALRDLFGELDRRGAKLMLSNADVPFVRDLYQGFRISRVLAPRAISCNPRKRAAVSEVLICNYATQGDA